MLIVPAGLFIGRQRELDALERLMTGGARLVSVIGGPGIGKTRLATEWAPTQKSKGFKLRGSDLSEARSIDQTCEALAKDLRVPLSADASSSEAVARLAEHVDSLGPTLLVLDNLEQLVPVSAQFLEPMLARAPELRILVTSRERLHLRAEHCVWLDALGVPTLEEHSPGELRRCESIRLFCARMHQAGVEEPNDADLPAIAAIVRRLEGIPLAIELAAARSSILGPTQLLERLETRLELLTRCAREASHRHSTLREAITWSSELLTRTERSALAQCSVFRGTFSLEAAEVVLSTPGRAIDILQSLHDKSLLRIERTAENLARFRLFEVVREFAEDLLAEDPMTARATLERHAFFFVGTPGSPPPRLGASLMRDELGNLSAVLDRTLAASPMSATEVDTALRALLLLEPFYLASARGRLEPYVASIDAVLGAVKSETDGALVASLLYTRAMADFVRGRIGEAWSHFQRSHDVAERSGAERERGLALTKLALFRIYGGDPVGGEELFGTAQAIARTLRDSELQAELALTRGGASIWQGRPDIALEQLRLALDHGAIRPRLCAMTEGQQALALVNLGALEEAGEALKLAFSRLRGAEDERVLGYLWGIQGSWLHARGCHEEARASFQRALEIHRAVGDHWSEGVHLGLMGHVAFSSQQLPEAQELYQRALLVLTETQERDYIAIFRAALGAIEAMLGNREAARAHADGVAQALDNLSVPATRRTIALYSKAIEITLATGSHPVEENPNGAPVLPETTLTTASANSSFEVLLAERRYRRAKEVAAFENAARPSADLEAQPPRAPSQLAYHALYALESPSAWVFGTEARWFTPPSLPSVSLLRARGLRLILARLVQHRLEQPGHALALDDLFRAGWPGERAAERAAANRVYVTLTKLRNLGLRGLLQSRDDGFLLDPTARVTVHPGFEPSHDHSADHRVNLSSPHIGSA